MVGHPDETGRGTPSQQFSDPLLVSAYDTLNPLGDDGDFWLEEVARLAPRTILDLGCGTGLLTCELARRGYAMVGVEPSGRMLDVARKKPCADEVQWIEGGHEKFAGLEADMVLMTSHVAQCFLDDAGWQEMLEAAHAALNPHGHVLFDSRTPIFPPFQTWPTEKAPRTVQDAVLGPIEWHHRLLEVKGSRVRYQLRFHFVNSGETRTSTDELTFRSREEITRSLESAGLEVKTVHGDWKGHPATATSPEMIFVAAML